MAKKLKEVYAGKFFVKYHNTSQEYSYFEFSDDVHMVMVHKPKAIPRRVLELRMLKN